MEELDQQNGLDKQNLWRVDGMLRELIWRIKYELIWKYWMVE